MRVSIDARLNIAKLYRILRLRPRALVNFEFFTRILYRIYGLTLIGKNDQEKNFVLPVVDIFVR